MKKYNIKKHKCIVIKDISLNYPYTFWGCIPKRNIHITTFEVDSQEDKE